MSQETVSDLVSRLEDVTKGLKGVQAKMQEFQGALHALQNFFGTTLQDAIARQDVGWLASLPQHFDAASQRVRKAADEVAAVLK